MLEYPSVIKELLGELEGVQAQDVVFGQLGQTVSNQGGFVRPGELKIKWCSLKFATKTKSFDQFGRRDQLTQGLELAFKEAGGYIEVDPQQYKQNLLGQDRQHQS